MSDDRLDTLRPFEDRPADAAVVLDFDGTLAPIVEEPARARPLDGVTDVLTRLAETFGLVGIISGRPVDFLVPLLPDGLVVSGLYGLEVVRDGERADRAAAGAWREVVADVVRSSTDRGPEGMLVESKGLSLTLHYRTRPDLREEVAEWARHQAARSGLDVRPAKMSIELHPPIAADKGTAVEELASGFGAVCFVGDDRGDLPAYDALDRLAARGAHVLRVAVDSDEAPAELIDRADLVVEGPAEVLALLRRLAR